MLRVWWYLFLCASTVAERSFQRAASEGQLLAQDDAFDIAIGAAALDREVGSAGEPLAEDDEEDDLAMDAKEVEAFQESFKASGCKVQQGPKMRGMCAYNRSVDDEYELDPDAAVMDPRHSFKELGYKRGFKAKLWQLGRAASGNRREYVELPGADAQQIVEAMYGIIAIKVPEECFGQLKLALTYKFTDNYKDNFRQIKAAKPRVLRVLGEVKNLCGAEQSAGSIFNRSSAIDPYAAVIRERDAKRAAKVLNPIKLGYWGILPELTVESKSVLAVRVYDELRVLRGDTGLRQIWHYAQTYMTGTTEARLRRKANNYRTQKQRKWILGNFVRLYKIMSYRDAHLEWVELDNRGSCLSAPKRDPICMLTELGSYSSSNFRMVLMFKERHWQSIGKAVKGFFDHPILAMKKFAFRTRDKWQRGDIGVKLGLVVSPLLQAAQIGGIVLGTVTAGSSTLTSVLATTLGRVVGIQVVLASQGLIQFLVSELFGIVTTPFKSRAKEFVVKNLISTSVFQQVLAGFDDKVREAVLEVKTQIDLQIESLMTSDRVLAEVDALKQQLKSARWASADDEEAGLALEDTVEDEVRRYVEGIVHEEFSQELVHSIEDKLESMADEEDPDYGWLKWDRWRLYRERNDASKLTGIKVRYTAPYGSLDTSWEGVVFSHSKGVNIFSDRNIKVMTTEGRERTVQLSDTVKNWMWVKDFQAYRKASQNALLWFDWEEYRQGGISKLKKKEVFLDTELAGCSNASAASGCLERISSGGNHVVKDISRLLNIFGRDTRVSVKPGDAGANACKLALTTQVKRCLRVRDPAAYQRLEEDRPRREKEAAWESGKLNATTSIVDQVVKAIKGAADCKTLSASKAAAIANGVMSEEGVGNAESEEFARMADGAEPEGDDDQEELGMKEVQQTAVSVFCS